MSNNYYHQISFNQYKDIRYYLLLFIVWPFLSFLIALSNFSRKEAKLIVYLFIIYYGLTFVNANSEIDAYRYALQLNANAQKPFSEFFNIVGGLYSDSSVDLIEPLISFIISRFTSNHSVYFAVWAAIFGFFYLKSIDLLYKRHLTNPGWNSILILLFFIMILPITSISGVRMWTAAWIFFYGAYHIIVNRSIKYFILTLLASLVHWSFISANAILLIYFLVGNRNIVYIPLAILSFFIPQVFSSTLQSISFKLGGSIQQRVSSYASEGYIASVQESALDSAWFIKIGSNLVFYYLILAIVIIHVFYGFMMKEKGERNLFSFLLLFLAFVNFGLPIPSFGERFMVIFFLFATYYLLSLLVKFTNRKIHNLTLLGLFPWLLYSAINFRIGSESVNVWIFTPVFGLPFIMPVVPLSDILF